MKNLFRGIVLINNEMAKLYFETKMKRRPTKLILEAPWYNKMWQGFFTRGRSWSPPSISLSPSLSLSIYLSFSLFFLSFFLSLPLFRTLSVFLSISISLSHSLCLSTFVYLSFSLSQSFYLSLSLFLTFSLSLSFYLSLSFSLCAFSLSHSLNPFVFSVISSLSDLLHWKKYVVNLSRKNQSRSFLQPKKDSDRKSATLPKSWSYKFHRFNVLT
jgi:hypothetical protein